VDALTARYDEAWRLLDVLFELAHAALAVGDAYRPDEAPHGVLLEPSMFAWALTVLGRTDATAVGDNFGLPHRDYSFTDSWSTGEQPTTRFVSHPRRGVGCELRRWTQRNER
jgi:hypothetical protein